jgi:cholesterol transport system auxiliary component
MDAGLAGAVQVIAPAWLRSSAMQYRLAYQSASERHAYLESRWAAPPAELVYGLLSRTLSGAGGCRLEVDLDEFIHDFPAADRSDGVVEARARLRAPGHGRVVASRSFSLRLPAPSPDAAGGVAALGRGSGQLAGELGAWLAQLGADPRNHKACTLP